MISKRKLLCATAVSFGAVLCACASDADGPGAPENDALQTRSQTAFHVPLAEVSGLALRGASVAGAELLAISDSSSDILVTKFVQGVPGAWRAIGSAPALAAAGLPATTQWEAVASDASKRIVVLNESPGRIVVLDPEGSAVTHMISLLVPRSTSLGEAWKDDENSRGEGMVLLRSGHVMILKEKEPRALIEFGPSGEVAKGYAPGDAVSSSDRFPLPAQATSTFHVLKHWSLKKPDKLPDGSELSVGPDGNLYMLSDQGNGFASMEMPIRASAAEVGFNRVVSLPDSLKKPEGLVILSGNSALVALDAERSDNLYALSW